MGPLMSAHRAGAETCSCLMWLLVEDQRNSDLFLSRQYLLLLSRINVSINKEIGSCPWKPCVVPKSDLMLA